VAEVSNHLVFADPSNTAARELCADALEQLGFATESATWRNAYLLGAKELRHGVLNVKRRNVSRDMLAALPLELLLDYFAVRLNAQKAAGFEVLIDWAIPDADERWAMRVQNATMTYLPGAAREQPDARVSLDRVALAALQMDPAGLPDAFERLVREGAIQVEGDVGPVLQLLGMLDVFETMFNVVEP